MSLFFARAEAASAVDQASNRIRTELEAAHRSWREAGYELNDLKVELEELEGARPSVEEWAVVDNNLEAQYDLADLDRRRDELRHDIQQAQERVIERWLALDRCQVALRAKEEAPREINACDQALHRPRSSSR
jgi:hypothetical protein